MSIAAILAGMQYIPKSLLPKVLGKVDKRFNNYFSRAAAYGYDINQAVDAINEKFKNDSQRIYENQLQSSTIRPDEMASRAEVSNRNLPGKVARTAASIGAGALLGGLGDISQTQEIPGNTGSGKNAGLGEAQSMQVPNPLSKEGLSEDLKAVESTQPISQAFEENFSHLFDRVREGLQNGISPEDIYDTLKKRPLYKPLVALFEKKEGRPFLEKIYEMQGSKTRNQDMDRKNAFLQGLAQLSQTIQGMKSR